MAKNQARQTKKNISDSNWHAIKIANIVSEFDTNLQTGLTTEAANNRLKKFGPNKIPEEKPLSGFKLFLSQFSDPLIYILVAAAIISLLLKEYPDAIIISIVVLLNTIIGYIQESKASEALTALQKVLKLKTVVIRNSEKQEIDQTEVVVGDIIVLNPGDKIPADGRLIEQTELEANEAPLTGESEAAQKFTHSLKSDTPLADRNNMVYMGTSIESGHAKAIVCATAINTELGKIAQVLKVTTEEKTPFQKKLLKFSKTIAIAVIIASVIILVEGLLTGEKFVEIFTTSVAIAVAAIPEGLPIAITVIFAIGMQRILKRHGLVRKLVAAETLGTTSVICSDKTGTLTEAKMKVVRIDTEKNSYSNITSVGKNKSKNAYETLRIATIRSDAFIENHKKSMEYWKITGRPTDKALLQAGIEAKINQLDLIKKEPIIDELKFESKNKFSVSLHKQSNKQKVLYVLGAPEIILNKSQFIYSNAGKSIKLTAKKIDSLKKKYQELTIKGLRVLAVAYRTTTDKKIQTKQISKLIFVGFVSLEDPLRHSAKNIMHATKRAGIIPVIITGDHRLTAQAIAAQLGLPASNKNIIEGTELSKMTDKELARKVNDITIYARTEPIQKLRIIKAWQSKGKVVAMTGDGINDAPAIKQADIGVSVGSGTAVAKEVSDLVLLSDNFSVIIAAIEEGRTIIDNIRKVITYLLSGTFTEIILIGGALFLGLPLPILAGQILWINLIEDSIPAIALAFEPKESDIMSKKPEPQDIPLLTGEMKMLIFTIGFVTDLFLLGLFWWLLNNTDYSLTHIRSFVFVGLLIDSIFYIFSCKSLRKNIWQINLLSNKYLIYTWLFSITMLFAALYIPFLQELLKIERLNSFDFALLFGFALIKLTLIEFVKWIYIRTKRV